jgi:hypothetical protein
MVAPRTTNASRTAVSGAIVEPPRAGLVIAAAVYAAVTLMLAYPALAGGFLVSVRSDQYVGGYTVRTFGAALWHATGHPRIAAIVRRRRSAIKGPR